MKRIVCVILAAVLGLALLTACGGKNKSAIDLTGTWQSDPGALDGYQLQVTFGKDGGLTYARSNGEDTETLNGTYALDGDNNLNLTIEGSKESYEYDSTFPGTGGFFWNLDGDTLYIGTVTLHRG